MQTRPPEAPKDQPPEAWPNTPRNRNRRPAPRRGIVRPETPNGCAYYLFLFAWCIAAFARHMDPAGQSGTTWHTATGVMFALGVGIVVTGIWTLITPPHDRLQGGWITVIGGFAVSGALWGAW